jgi:glucokinase
METDRWTMGVDLGGTKIEVAWVDSNGKIAGRIRKPTIVEKGAEGIVREIVEAIRQLLKESGEKPLGIGVGVAGQVEGETGKVRFAPNLDWHDVPLQANLKEAIGLPVVVTNDVRAATWGEWRYGSGKNCDNLVCLFIGTGVGGGVVSDGKILSGASNAAGELGHMTVDLNGPPCHCHNHGCLEALAGGWAIARRARQAVADDPVAGADLLKLARDRREAITAEIVARAAKAGDPLAGRIVEETLQAIIAGCVGLVNAFNPTRLILGGGVIEGLPQLVKKVEKGVHQRALKATLAPLQVVKSALGNDAGVIGAAALAMLRFSRPGDVR